SLLLYRYTTAAATVLYHTITVICKLFFWATLFPLCRGIPAPASQTGGADLLVCPRLQPANRLSRGVENLLTGIVRKRSTPTWLRAVVGRWIANSDPMSCAGE